MSGNSGHIVGGIHQTFDPIKPSFSRPNPNHPSLHSHHPQHQYSSPNLSPPTRRRVTNRFLGSNKNPYRDFVPADRSLAFGQPSTLVQPNTFIWTHLPRYAFNPMFAIPLESSGDAGYANSSFGALRVKKQRRIKTTTAASSTESDEWVAHRRLRYGRVLLTHFWIQVYLSCFLS